ncbi:MAG TPA: peptidoglycan DD-metalloendopeptidase family protein [Clostridia bacterium]|nr:peptidoglycan DD-metalloendopeptidase family protein [Clostridia bacterium]
MDKIENILRGLFKIEKAKKMFSFAMAGALVISMITPVSSYADKGFFGLFSSEQEQEQQEQRQETIYPQEIKRDIEELLKVRINSFAIRVDGEIIAGLRTRREAEEILEAIRDPYLDREDGVEILEIYFKEKVEVSEEPVPQDLIGKSEEILEYIKRGTKEKKVHVIEKGDYYGKIAEMYGIHVSDLEAANPDVSPRKLQIGQKINLLVPKPFITVMTTENKVYDESIKHDTVYENNSGIYKGEYAIKKRGQDGIRTIEAKIVRANGIEYERIILSEEITKEPVTQITYKGIKDPPPRIGTGTFQKPSNRGYVTSEFGWRWGRRHEGIDIGMNTGTIVRAADGGVVTFAGYKSGYGYVVFVNHGANMESRYAHLSKIQVSKGEKVYKGEQIALSGNTGVSTGPHLHFEIRKNGVPQNPRNFLNF